MTNDLLGVLNPEQQAVVQATEGPVLVLAGAGSGKTRALTHRLAYLVTQRKAAPEELLAVTFTNKAAKEMRERVVHLLGSATSTAPVIGTFHSLGARILREQHHHTPRSVSFTILDTSDSDSLVKQSLDALGLSTREWNPRSIRAAISRAKNILQTPADVAAGSASPTDEVVASVYARYQALLARNDAYDFDDLILATVELLAREATIREAYRRRWRYLSVDEYQDTNGPQERLLGLLMGPEKNICAVGDDYQAIYSWRGAQVDHILHFASRYPQCTTVYLTQNYRSTPAILSTANHIIAQNREQMHKKLWTARDSGQPVRLVALASDRQEAGFVRQHIETYVATGGSLADCAVLYRTNAQSRVLEEEFLSAALPYTIVGGFRFYDRAEVKDAMAFLHFWANPRSAVALRRLGQSFIKGVGPKTLARLEASADSTGHTVADALASGSGLTVRQRASVSALVNAYQTARESKAASVAELLQRLLAQSGYERYLKSQPEGAERWENIEELYNVAAQYTEVQKFVEDVALMSDIDDSKEALARITCMTLHAAKGLEFKCVYIVGVEEGLLPHLNSINQPATLEEERRLFYVGITRAREQLTISYARTRYLRGESLPQLPSRFLKTLPDAVIRHDAIPQLHAAVKPNDFGLRLSVDTAEPSMVVAEIGEFISHPIFGRGVVIQNSGSLLTCVFPAHGVKTIDGTAVQSSQ